MSRNRCDKLSGGVPNWKLGGRSFLRDWEEISGAIEGAHKLIESRVIKLESNTGREE